MKHQKINWRLYLALGFLSIVIILLSLLVKNCTEWFTIMSGIGCGAFSSVLIAFLIEVSSVYQKRQKNTSVFESYFQKLYFSFSQLLFSFYIASDKEKRNEVGELRWFDWLERIIDEQNTNPTPSTKTYLIDKLQDTQKELEKIAESKLLLLSQELIDDTEIITLMNIKIDLSAIEGELEFSDTDWSNIKLIISDLKEHISESQILSKFNEVPYKDKLLKLLFIRCYLKKEGQYASN